MLRKDKSSSAVIFSTKLAYEHKFTQCPLSKSETVPPSSRAALVIYHSDSRMLKKIPNFHSALLARKRIEPDTKSVETTQNDPKLLT